MLTFELSYVHLHDNLRIAEAFLAHSEKIYEKRLFSSRRAKSSKGHDCQKFQRNAAVRRAPGLLKTIVKPHRFQLNYHIKER